MLIRDVMSKNVITVAAQETLVELLSKFLKYNFHTFPVVDDKGKIIGTVNYEDIMKIFVPHNPALEKLLKSTHFYNIVEEDILESELPKDFETRIKVRDIMDYDVITIGDEETIADARNCMKRHNVGRMSVTKNEKLVGFITLFDIIIALFKKKDIIK